MCSAGDQDSFTSITYPTYGNTFGCTASLKGRQVALAGFASEAQAKEAAQQELLDLVMREGREDALPNILDGTQLFMEKARQLDEVGFPGHWSNDLRRLRRNLLHEEFFEYRQAEIESDLIEVVDGLLDVIVVAWGTLLAYVGPDKAKAAAAQVVKSNLSKVIGEGLPIKDAAGKVQKPDQYIAPDIRGVLTN